MEMDGQFWNGKRVFLTGHTGFKGAWLSLWLASLGARITGYSLAPPSEPNLFNIAKVRDNLATHYDADILDLEKMQAAVAEAAPEIIIHMAAQSLVRASYREPVYTYAVNVMGSAHVLEATRHVPSVKAVLIVTSDKCYETREGQHPHRESDPLGGHDPYSASKACAELVTASYQASLASGAGGLQHIASARAGNVIGGGDWAADRLIPDCIRAFSQGQPVVLRYPDAVRPWQHVLEPLAGYLTLVEHLFNDGERRYATAWNFGPDSASESTVGDVAGRIAQAWGNGAEIRVNRSNATHHETTLLRLDSTKARSELGWLPRWPLDRSIEETLQWYRAWQKNENMQQFSIRQIESYLRSAP